LSTLTTARRFFVSAALLGLLSAGSGLIAGCGDNDRDDIEVSGPVHTVPFPDNNPTPTPTPYPWATPCPGDIPDPGPSPSPSPEADTVSFKIEKAAAPWGLDHGYALGSCAFDVRLTAIDGGEVKEYTSKDGITVTALPGTLQGEGYYGTNATVTYVISGVPDSATAPADDQKFTLTSLTVRSKFGYSDRDNKIQKVESDIEWLDYDGGKAVKNGDALSAAANTFAGGSGSKSNPYLVSNPRQFDNLRGSSDKCFAQTRDIDFDHSLDTSGIGETGGWVPIEEFSGSYDGGGFSLINLFPMSLGDQNWGIFKRLNGASFSNLTIGPLLADVTSAQQVGILALYAGDAPVKLSSCVNNADLATIYSDNVGAGSIAGLIGSCTTDLTLENCSNNGRLAAPQEVNNGSVCGLLGSFAQGKKLTLIGCSNTGDLSGTSAAGLVGFINNLQDGSLSVSGCSNSGSVQGRAEAAGLFRDIEIDDIAEFSACENSGAVKASGLQGECFAGGLIGKLGSYITSNAKTISACKNSGNVRLDTVSSSGNIGGLLGTNNAVLTIEKSSSTGSVTIGEMQSGTGCAGGLVGFSSTGNEVTFTDCEEPALPTIASDKGGTSYVDTFLGRQQ